MRASDITKGYGFGFVRYTNESNDPNAVTARMAGPLMLPTELLARFIGDAKAPPELAHKAKSEPFDNTGHPVMFTIDASGQPRVTYGAGVVAAAMGANAPYLHTEVVWLGGSDQQRDNTYCPAAISRVGRFD